MDFISTLATDFINHFTYLGLLGALILCAFGFPIPEEATFFAGGYLVYSEKTNIWLTIIVCIFGVMAGDSMIFSLGRRWGDSLFRHRIMRRIISEARIERVRSKLLEHRMKTVFICRFMAGARTAAFFTAGSIRMSFIRFFIVDLIAAAISVPIMVTLGWHFGDRIDEAARWLRGFNRASILLTAAAVVVLILIARRVRTARKAHQGSPPPSSDEPPAG